MTRLLVTGDLHLGRASTRVPEDLDGLAVAAAGAWRRIVDAAIEHGVDALCLTGDVADADNRFWEAIGELERGLRRLGEHGIQTLAVAGNHDHDVLPRLAENLDAGVFRLLGHGGRWERHVLEGDGPPLTVDGWSFPTTYVRNSPLDDYDAHHAAHEAAHQAAHTTHGPHVVMVHGDLDAPASAYAPLDRRRMLGMPAHACLLGHVHAPAAHRDTAGPTILYPGSPQALDPGETGTHGPWLIEFGPGGIDRIEHLPLSSVRYESHEIDLTDVEEPTAFDAAVLGSIDERARELVSTSGEALRYLSLRLRLTGRTPLAPRLRQLAVNVHELDREVDHVRVGVDRVAIEAMPTIDLHEHARDNTPPGAVARLLLALEEPEPTNEVRALIDQTRHRLAELRSRADYLPLQVAADVGAEAARAHLRHEAHALLNELLGQTASP